MSVFAGTAGTGAAGNSARSLASNPALAIGANGTEIAGDYQSTLVFLTYKRAGTDPDGDPYGREKAFLHGEVPYAAVRSDVFRGRGSGEGGHIGLGFSLSLPFSSGANYKSDSGGRYHVVDATTYSLYLAPAVSVKPMPALRIGVAPVLAMSSLTVTKRTDLAPSLGELLGCDQSVPGDCPDAETGLLEGEFRVKDARGFAPTYQIGAAWDFADRGSVGFGYTGGTLITMVGRSVLVPSLDFNVESHADFEYTQYLPPIANLGGRAKINDQISATFEGQWIGYSASRIAKGRIKNSEIKATQADLQALLDFLAINEGDLVEGILDKDQTTKRGWQNAWNAVAGAEYALDKVSVRAEGGFFTHVTPDGYVSTANLDFDNFTIGASAAWRPVKMFSVAFNVNQFINGGRTVKDSSYDPTKPTSSGLAYPSGAGEYTASATRVTVTTLLNF